MSRHTYTESLSPWKMYLLSNEQGPSHHYRCAIDHTGLELEDLEASGLSRLLSKDRDKTDTLTSKTSSKSQLFFSSPSFRPFGRSSFPSSWVFLFLLEDLKGVAYRESDTLLREQAEELTIGAGWLDPPASGARMTFLLIGLDFLVYPAFDRAVIKSLRPSLSSIPKAASFESFKSANAAVVLQVL